MRLFRRKSVIAVLLLVAVAGIAAGVEGLRYWWYHAYSVGSRTGVIRKLSVKGSPLCKYLAAELVLIGNQVGQPEQLWEFTVDNDDPSNPIVKRLHEAERGTKPVTVDYRQHLGNKGRLWVCDGQPEYYVTNVE